MKTVLGWCRQIFAVAVLAGLVAAPAGADELWVAPTYQQDVGGFGIGSNGVWPVTAIGAVRLAWGVPANLQTFQSAKVALIPHSPGGIATLTIFVCEAKHGDPVLGVCSGPIPHAFIGVANQLLEVDISAAIAPAVGTAGESYLAVIAFTAPTTSTDHIVGLRFNYAPSGAIPAGLVGFFAGSACPAGWAEYASASGRVVVGLPPGGTAEGTIGSPLANLGTRTISEVPSHVHVANPPSVVSGINGTHSHNVRVATPDIFGTGNRIEYGNTRDSFELFTSSAGAHSHDVDIPAFTTGATGVTSVDVSMPYIQLMACRKS